MQEVADDVISSVTHRGHGQPGSGKSPLCSGASQFAAGYAAAG